MFTDEGFCDDMSRSDEGMLPLEKLQLLAHSDIIAKRREGVLKITETLEAVHQSQEDVHNVASIICKLSDDYESLVRLDLAAWIPSIATSISNLADANTDSTISTLQDIISRQLIPIVIKLIEDPQSAVRNVAEDSLCALFEKELVTEKLSTEWIYPFIAMQIGPAEAEARRIERTSLMCRLAKFATPEIRERCFFDPFLALATDPLEQIRKTCASKFGEFAQYMSNEIVESVLLQRFLKLCHDECSAVRVACASSFVHVSCLLQTITRLSVIPDIYDRFFEDRMQSVYYAAYEHLGAVIATFGDSVEYYRIHRKWPKLLHLNSKDDSSEISEDEYNTFQYWKTPLPDVELSLEQSFSLLVCKGESWDQKRPPLFWDQLQRKRKRKWSQPFDDSFENNNSFDIPSTAQLSEEDVRELCVPPVLLDRYLDYTEYNEETVVHCAAAFPAVVATIGSHFWHLLYPLFEFLASHIQEEVRCIVASFLYDLAKILGLKLSQKHLFNVILEYMVEADAVKAALLPNLKSLICFFPPDVRPHIFLKMDSFCRNYNWNNWRFRAGFVEQLSKMLQDTAHFSSPDLTSILPIALEFLEDQVSCLRHEAAMFVISALEVYRNDETQIKNVISYLHQHFCMAENFQYRQLFLYICQRLNLNLQKMILLICGSDILALAYDPAHSVRLSLAVFLSKACTDDAICRIFKESFESEWDLSMSLLRCDTNRSVHSVMSENLPEGALNSLEPKIHFRRTKSL